MDITADDGDAIRRQQSLVKWFDSSFIHSHSFVLGSCVPPLLLTGRRDRKKKKFSGAKEIKKIRTESGQKIAASYKTGLYEDWLKRSKLSRYVALKEQL
jgi:hypothetical protein